MNNAQTNTALAQPFAMQTEARHSRRAAITPGAWNRTKADSSGTASGHEPVGEHLKSREANGLNHIALNLRFNKGPTTLEILAREILPNYTS